MVGNVIHVRNRTGSPDEVYVGRPGPFGNPFVLGNGVTRANAIAAFETYMQNKVRSNPEYRAQVRSLYGKTLLCFCAPLDCHAWSLLAMANQIANEEK